MSASKLAVNRLADQNREELLDTSRRLLAEAQALSSRIAAINEIAVAINRSLDLDAILSVVGKQAKWLLDFDHCSVSMREGKQRLRTHLLYGKAATTPSDTLDETHSISMAVRTGYPQVFQNNEDDKGFGGFQSLLVLPLEIEREIAGTLNFAAHTPNLYTQEDIRIGYLLAVQVAAAIRNASRFAEINRLYTEIEREKQKSDDLLLNILPSSVADELKRTGQVRPVHYDSATVMFIDFENFTPIAAILSPKALLDELDYCFTRFDRISERYNLEKLKTNGDSYMAAGGIPIARDTHALDAVLAAQEICAFIRKRKREKEMQGEPFWDIRVGIHTGPLVSGVIGRKKFVYDVWGDTVNVAARMQSSGEAGKINISPRHL